MKTRGGRKNKTYKGKLKIRILEKSLIDSIGDTF